MRLKLFILLSLAAVSASINAQQVTTFEARYFSKDPKADGVTDLHGKTEIFDNEQRVAFLNSYASYASRFWGNPGFDKPLFSDADVSARLATIKLQPSTSVRRTLRLEDWRAYGYKKGKEIEVASRWKEWTASGARVKDGCLVLDGTTASMKINPLDWRFRMRATLSEVPENLHVILSGSAPLTNRSLSGVEGPVIDIPVGPHKDFEIYGDLVNGVIFLSSGGKTIKEIPVESLSLSGVEGFALSAVGGKASVESISLYNFVNHQEDDPRTPYWTEMIFDEDFEPVPSMHDWQSTTYEDSSWEIVRLPSSHGGFKGAGESYYLRTQVKVGDFRKATLRMETLDPGGEVWVNGEVAAVLNGRLPREVDVTEYLIPDKENTIAVRVKPYYTDATVFHCPNDHNIGWFLGRTELVLTDEIGYISEGLVHTLSLDGPDAVQHHKVTLRNDSTIPWKGSLTVNYYPWFPSEGALVASVSKDVELRPQVDNPIGIDVRVESPDLWSVGDPHLYKVEMILKDADGEPVDDYVTTTGIRLIEQKEGRVAREGARNFQTAAFTARATHGLGLANVRNLEFLEQFLETALAFGTLHALRLENRHDVILDGKLAEDGSFLRQVTDTEARTLVHRLVRHLDVIEEDVPRFWTNHAHDHIERRRLARTVWPEQPDDFTLRHADGHVAHDLATAIDLSQVFRANGTH